MEKQNHKEPLNRTHLKSHIYNKITPNDFNFKAEVKEALIKNLPSIINLIAIHSFSEDQNKLSKTSEKQGKDDDRA